MFRGIVAHFIFRMHFCCPSRQQDRPTQKEAQTEIFTIIKIMYDDVQLTKTEPSTQFVRGDKNNNNINNK